MVWPDIVNGCFEAFASVAYWLNIRALYRAKRVKGVSIVSFTFFAAWGYWNLFYYPHLGQWWSFFGGLGIVVAGTIWVIMAVYYERRYRKARKVCPQCSDSPHGCIYCNGH